MTELLPFDHDMQSYSMILSSYCTNENASSIVSFFLSILVWILFSVIRPKILCNDQRVIILSWSIHGTSNRGGKAVV